MPEQKILVIGASIIDLTGSPEKELILGDSCPGNIHISHGGVARNIAENLQRLGISTSLLTALGNDLFGKKMQFDCQNIGINIQLSAVDDEFPTSVYLLVNNQFGDIEFGLADNKIIDILDINYLKKQKKHIDSFNTIVLDTNLPEATLDYITSEFSGKRLFLDLVTREKSAKVKSFVGRFFGIKPNIAEAEELSGIQFNSQKDLFLMRDYFLRCGVKQVFISMSKKGSFYADENECGFVNAGTITPVNTSGAGDSYTAGIVYSNHTGKSISESAIFGAGTALASLMHRNASNPKLNVKMVEEIINKYHICSQNI